MKDAARNEVNNRVADLQLALGEAQRERERLHCHYTNSDDWILSENNVTVQAYGSKADRNCKCLYNLYRHRLDEGQVEESIGALKLTKENLGREIIDREAAFQQKWRKGWKKKLARPFNRHRRQKEWDALVSPFKNLELQFDRVIIRTESDNRDVRRLESQYMKVQQCPSCKEADRVRAAQEEAAKKRREREEAARQERERLEREERERNAPSPPSSPSWSCHSVGGNSCCYNGDALVCMADGTLREARSVEVGDVVFSPDSNGCSYATVIARYVQVSGSSRDVAVINATATNSNDALPHAGAIGPEKPLFISLAHRVRHPRSQQWIKPETYPGAVLQTVDIPLHNFVLDAPVSMVVNDIIVSSVGQFCDGSHDRMKPLHMRWGSSLIVDRLRSHPQWPDITFAAVNDPHWERLQVVDPSDPEYSMAIGRRVAATLQCMDVTLARPSRGVVAPSLAHVPICGPVR
eukprot:GFYU01003340.1.p1 GENE.GFYU01003340.1~~GFYU01003340.1.p1  ORF type:complete len:465 (-),score=46.50 GFYU01003340.1:71-1465(-)